MSWLAHECRLLVRSKMVVSALILLLLLSTLAVLCGVHEVARQGQTIDRLAGLQQLDLAAQERKYTDGGNAGSAAYYTFHSTWDAPSATAFLALGLRDAAPYVLRVRALALQAQLHEGESFNPELALAGRFDFAFLLVYLAPLFLIALLYDLISGERSSGRLDTLMAMPCTGRRLWLRRAGLRTAMLFGCLVLPVIAGASISDTAAVTIAGVLLVIAAYLAFWCGLALIVATRGASSAFNAMALTGCWAVVTLILPTLANAAVARAVPVHQGVNLMLEQRQAVHGAWDLPPDATMEKFFLTHPEWRNTAPLPYGFHWKWYFAFQQLGDESVVTQVEAYRKGLLARQRWTERLGWLLPGIGVQAALHRMANTDLQAQLAYQDRIAEFHSRLRAFYYPYLFNDLSFGAQDFSAQPSFSSQTPSIEAPLGQLLGLMYVGIVTLLLGACAAGRIRPITS